MEHDIKQPKHCFCESAEPGKCPTCDGGLAICKHCGKAEAELAEPCIDPREALRKDPGAIVPLIAILEELRAEGVTHLHCHNSTARVELVTGVADGRSVWNDGRNLSAQINAEETRPAWGR